MRCRYSFGAFGVVGVREEVAAAPFPLQLEQLQGSLYATAADEPSAERLEGNFRDPQDLNQRPVLASFTSSKN